MDPELLIERVKRWGAIAQNKAAEHAILGTLAAFREAMFEDEAAALANELPERFAQPLRSQTDRAVVNLEQLYCSASRHEGVPIPEALEHVQAVCQALTSVLPEAAIARLTKALPAFAELFIVPDRASHGPPVISPHGHTVSEGRPGSEHPLATARPVNGGFDKKE